MQEKLIIFDFDGTLADTAALILWTYRKTIRELGADERSDEAVKSTIGLPLREGFRQLFPLFSDKEWDECVVTYRRIFDENKTKLVPKLFPNVKSTLAKLHELGFIMSVASSRSNASLTEFCEANKLSSFFFLILGADDVTKAKPDPEPVLKTLAALSISPEAAMVVGDMPVDIIMGRRAGCRTVGVTYGNSCPKDLINAGADFVIDEFQALLAVQ